MTEVDRSFDLVVIGSGGAAFAAAIRAAALGARAAVVERGDVGGTCVNVGCVPSKTLLAAAEALHRAGHHPFAGVPTSAGTIDLGAVIAQKDELVGRLRGAKYVDLAEEHGFEILHGTARFRTADRVELDGRPLQAGAFVVAAGAEPAVPDLPGLAKAGFLTSTTAMSLRRLPPRLVTIGGGYVGMEQSQLLSRLGTSVTIVGRLAPRAEPELSEWMGRIFADEAIEVRPTRAVAVERTPEGVAVACADGSRCPADAVLVATGRRPRTVGLGLAEAGVELDLSGFVVVDEQMRTTSPRIFAAGDVTGGPQFVYVAAAQGAVAAENALTGAKRTMDYVGLPSVIFTSPALASAGLTEREALASGHRCDCRVLPLEHVPRALVNRDTRGAVKLVADADTGRLLGVHAVADQAGELMLAATYAIRSGMTVEMLADTWAPYLTMSEALKLAAQSFRADVARLSCCAA